MNYLQTAEAYLADPTNLYQQFKEDSYSRSLEVLQKFAIDEAGLVKVQSNSYTGDAQNYDGYGSTDTSSNSVINANTGWVTYQLNQFKYYPMPLDQIQSEESLNLSISRINGLIRYKVNADVDTYRFSKLASEAGVFRNGGVGSDGNFPETTPVDLTPSNILETIENDVALMADEEVTGADFVLYTTPQVVKILESADKLTKFIDVRDYDRDGVNLKVRYIITGNGDVEIESVPSRYFHSFTAGNKDVKNSNVVGDTVDTNFRYMLLTRQAVNAVVKVHSARVIPNGYVKGFLGDFFELYIYHDIFVIDRHKAVGEAVNFLTPKAFNGVIVNKISGTTTLTYDANGGTIAKGDTKTVSTYISFDRVTSKPTPTRSGYVFDGWGLSATSTSLMDPQTLVTPNLTVYALWTAE